MATHRLSSIAIRAAFMLLVSGADDVVLGQARIKRVDSGPTKFTREQYDTSMALCVLSPQRP